LPVMEKIGYRLEELIRFVSIKFILGSAAWTLPRKLALKVSGAIGLLLLVLPIPGHATYFTMRQVFGASRPEAFCLAWNWLTRPFRDFIIAKRFVYGRENWKNYNIIQNNTEGINALRNSGKSYIIVCGHFAREAEIPIYLAKVTPGNLFRVVRFPKLNDHRLANLRTHIQIETLVKAFHSVGRENLNTVDTGPTSNAAATLRSALMKPGNVVMVNIDAPYEIGSPGTFSRPFAGSTNRAFAKGVVGLARMAQCAMITCIWWKKDDGGIVLEWGEPVRVTPRGRKIEDIQVMNQFLDKFEVAIGKRPTQYVLKFGGERLWNSKLERWQDQ
jgi:lauroyl/myristoyl acyltransferase